MAIEFKALKGYDIKGLEKEIPDERRANITIYNKEGKFMSYFVKNVGYKQAVKLLPRAIQAINSDNSGEYVPRIDIIND